MSKYPHVVIVGAGFGGLGVAEQLAHVPVHVTLIESIQRTPSPSAFWRIFAQ